VDHYLPFVFCSSGKQLRFAVWERVDAVVGTGRIGREEEACHTCLVEGDRRDTPVDSQEEAVGVDDAVPCLGSPVEMGE
jgi:hypothetical protein